MNCFSDTFDIVQYPHLLAPDHEDAAQYPSIGTFHLDRESTVDDICDFIVEYINSDVLVSDKHRWVLPSLTSSTGFVVRQTSHYCRYI